MAAKDNTITAADTCAALDEEFVQAFARDYDTLAEALGLYDVQVVSAGTAIYQYRVTGDLSATTPAEGDETPLTKYTVAKSAVGDVSPKRYAKLTTVEADHGSPAPSGRAHSRQALRAAHGRPSAWANAKCEIAPPGTFS